MNLDPLQWLTDDFPREIFGSCPTGGKTPRDSSNAANVAPHWIIKMQVECERIKWHLEWCKIEKTVDLSVLSH